MRTTLTLDPDVEQMLEAAVHRERRPFKQVVNDALRRGLAPTSAARKPSQFRVVPHRTKLVAGFDHARLNALADQLEDETLLAPPRPVRKRRAK
jgi:hypothetical protein